MNRQAVLRSLLLWLLVVCGVILLILILPAGLERKLAYGLRKFIGWLKGKLIT